MAIGIFSPFSRIFNAIFRLEHRLVSKPWLLWSLAGDVLGSFDYTKEALRVARGIVEINFLLNIDRAGDVNCIITLPIEMSFSREVKSC